MLEKLNVRILCMNECVRIKSVRMLSDRKFKFSYIIFDYSNIFIVESTKFNFSKLTVEAIGLSHR